MCVSTPANFRYYHVLSWVVVLFVFLGVLSPEYLSYLHGYLLESVITLTKNNQQMTQIYKSCVRSCLHGSHESHGSQVKIRADTRDTPETKFHGAQSAQVYMIIPKIRWSRKKIARQLYAVLCT